MQSDGDLKSVQGNIGHATAAVLMDTYAHTQDKPRLELTEKIEAQGAGGLIGGQTLPDYEP